MLKKYKLASAILVGVPLSFAATAHAQTQVEKPVAPAVERESAEAEGSLPDAKSLPLTRAVVTRAAIDAQNPDDGSDALKNVAGITSQNAKGAENGSISIRGIKLNLFSSYRLNGGLAVTGVITTPVEDKERVEALKGANALLFGVASPGGIVNLVTKRAGEVDVSRAVLYGNSFGQYGTSYDFGRKFGDEKQVGIRINASAVHAENGIDGANGHGSFGSLAADWKATKDLKFELDVERYQRAVVEQANIQPTLVGANTKAGIRGTYLIPPMLDPTKLLSGSWDVYTPKTLTVDLRANYTIAKDWEVLVEAGRSHSDRDRIQSRVLNYNVLTGAASLSSTLLHDQEYTNTFGRVEVSGKFDTWFLKHGVTVGLSSSERYVSSPSNSNTVTAPQNIFNPLYVAAPVFANVAQTYKPQDPKDIGMYVYDTVQIGKDWKALVGLRQTRTMADNVNVANGPHVQSTSSVVTPAIGLMYDFARRSTIYTSYMKGLEDGAQAPLQALNSFVVLPSSVSSQKEIGIRSSYLKGIAASVAVFDITQANATLNPTTNIFGNDGTLRFRGIESTLNVELNRSVSLNGAAQLINAVQNTVNDPLASGMHPENIPRITSNVGVQYKPAMVAGLTLNGGASFVGERFIGSENQGRVPGFTLFNMGSTYSTRISGHKTDFQINVDNLFNKSYWSSATSTALGAGMNRGFKFNVKMDL